LGHIQRREKEKGKIERIETEKGPQKRKPRNKRD
jgi:hypothetical protein